jgi:hypothetical protein
MKLSPNVSIEQALIEASNHCFKKCFTPEVMVLSANDYGKLEKELGHRVMYFCKQLGESPISYRGFVVDLGFIYVDVVRDRDITDGEVAIFGKRGDFPILQFLQKCGDLKNFDELRKKTDDERR